MNWKYVRHFFRGLIYIPTALFVIIALLVGTPLGSQITITALNGLLPQLKVSYQSGTLNKTIHIKKFSWIDNGVSVTADDILLTWRPHCFLQKQLCVNDIKATNTRVKIVTSTATSSKSPEIKNKPNANSDVFLLPFGIIAKHAEFNDILVDVDNQKYASKNLDFSAQWLESGMIITKLNSNQFSMSGVWGAEKSTEVNTNNNSAKDSEPITLPSVELPFQLTVHHSNLINSQLELDGKPINFKRINIDGFWRGKQLTLKQLQLSHNKITAALSGNLKFTDNYPLTLSVNAKLDNRSGELSSPLPWLTYLKDIHQQFLQAKLSKNLSSLNYSLKLSGDINSQAAGEVNLLQENLPFKTDIKKLQGRWKTAQGLIYADQTTITANGSINSVNLVAKGQFKTPFIPQINLDVNGHISRDDANFEHLIVKSSSGNIEAKGKISWNNQYVWDLDGNFAHFQLQNFGKRFSNKIPQIALNGMLVSNGKFQHSNWYIKVKDSDLAGSYNNSPFNIKGSVDFNSSYQLRSQGLSAEFLGNKLQLTKKSNDKLEGLLEVQQLSTLIPDLKGSINTQFTTSLNQQPKFDFDLQGQNIEYQDYQLESIKSSGSYFPLKNHFTDSLTQLTNLSIFKHKLRLIQIKTQADLNRQSSDITIHSALNARLKIDSHTTDTGWAFTLPTLDIFTAKTMWQLNKPISASWNSKRNQASISAFCLLKNGEGLCLNDEAIIGKSGHAQISYNGGIKEITKPYLPKHIELEGNAHLNSTIEWKQDQKPTGNFNLDLPSGKIRIYPHKDVPREFGYQSFSLTGNLNKQWLKLASSLKAKNLAHLDAKLNIGVQPEHNLNGLLDINNIELAPIAEFIPLFQKFDGKLTSKIKVSGTLKDPLFDGEAEVKDTEIALLENPTKIHGLNAKLLVKNRKVNIFSNWNMDEGTASLNGILDWQDQKLKGKLALKGKNLSVIKPPLAVLTVNPDIKIDIDGKQVAFSGKVDVPDGAITIAPLPKEGTPLSDDVVFVNQKKKSLSSNFLQLTTNLDVNVSDKVEIKGMGLSANLGGKISLRQKQQEKPLLFGSIKVLNGSYRFLGQTLNITDGNLEFVGPADNPNIYIVAVKNIQDEDLTVGVKMTGQARKPTVTLFSSPVKEQAEIVSYLFQGHSFFNDTTDNSNDALLLSAALTIGSHTGNNPISAIGNSAESVLNKLGIKNVQLNANDQGKVAVSGNIGDRLLVKYGYGVFNPGYELSLRFYLLSQLYLETVSSAVGQSLDIYYRFSFN
ncbi:translocation/assembly module TamB domain-containing protein [Parashewanella tropica]|uniref:translocation/assembly module TamB domain-containing protein n=1 Tax=Parashewanella tropica TaxID=2547970 RepID=UPI00105A64D9|nr:translocation/assembly module TamB domain-containing protein [Parashewanella tropica]